VIATGAPAFTDALLRMIASSYSDPPAVAWRVVSLMAAHQPDVPAFALAIGDPQSRRVLVHGTARAVVDDTEVDGRGLWTWAECAFGPHRKVALTVSDEPVVAAPRSDLRDGVLDGAGLVLEPETAPPDPTPAPSPVPTPAPTPAPASRPSAVPPRPPTVADVRTAIAASASETVQLAPAIAALRGNDGTRVQLDRDYVLGRDPRHDPAVVRGTASPVQIKDDEHLISRVHAYVSVAIDSVTVRDAGSANGTFVAAPGDAGWSPIGRDPVPLPIGHSLRVGHRVYTHVPAEERP
jgi:pSer/pThr/pTyr-binding forkhead associated (FHA) protein